MLNLRQVEGNPRRAAIHDAADGGAVGLAKCGDAKKSAEATACHWELSYHGADQRLSGLFIILGQLA